jgi:hypothetical protein
MSRFTVRAFLLAGTVVALAPQAVGQAVQKTESAVGQAGVRQVPGATKNVTPMARIDSRIQNRVQSRIMNRLDRNYEAASATDPFKAAGEKQRRSSPR